MKILLVSANTWNTYPVYPWELIMSPVLLNSRYNVKKQIWMNLVHSPSWELRSRIFLPILRSIIRNIDNTDTINSRWLSHWNKSLVQPNQENSTARIILAAVVLRFSIGIHAGTGCGITASSWGESYPCFCRHWKTMPMCNLCGNCYKETARMFTNPGEWNQTALWSG